MLFAVARRTCFAQWRAQGADREHVYQGPKLWTLLSESRSNPDPWIIHTQFFFYYLVGWHAVSCQTSNSTPTRGKPSELAELAKMATTTSATVLSKKLLLIHRKATRRS
jgi:hypothetical protein